MHKAQRISKVINACSFDRNLTQILSLISLVIFLLSSNAHANFQSTESSSTGMCPANHKMYYIGANAPTATATFPVTVISLSWTAGNSTRTFTFNEATGNKTFDINFSSIIDKNNSEGAPPFYGSIAGNTSSALNLFHNSTSNKTNHILDISINRSVSKSGYKIQDLDSTTTGLLFRRTPYIEQVDVSTNNGRLTFNNIFHTINTQNDIVTAREGENCGVGECNINASWNYKTANSILNLKHNNTLNETSGAHAVGYSDFYFCLAPPKIIVKKALNGARVNDTADKRDQFEVNVNREATTLNSFTTTGSGATVTTGSSSAVSLAESTSYTITERVMNGTTLGDIANYNATYTCNNATTGSTTVMPTTAMTYNATDKTRSFTLSNATYGDEITCTITNTPKSYTFSGTIFNDNGGITSPDPQLIESPYNNPNFFNGIFDTSEAGIDGLNIVKARLSDCSSNPSANPIIATNNVTNLGKYNFTVLSKDLAGKTDLCIEEIEPNNWVYSVDTTPNIRKFTFNSSVLTYQTGVKINGNTLNLDFGNVIKENTALVLKKYQYINNCPSTLNYTNINESTSPSTGFSTASIKDIDPGKCIAYKITATNRAYINIDNFIMKDVLQKKGVSSALVTSVLTNPASASADYASDSVAIGQNGTVKTKPLTLTPRAKRDFYFNTKYGTTTEQ